MGQPPTRVLVVDDSAAMRHLLTVLLGRYPDIEVVGTASDAYVARERIKELRPDVITLDIEMPRMNGLTFLERLMRLRPMPVVMVSNLVEQDAEPTLRALELGAVDFITKPKTTVAEALDQYAEELAGKLRAAARADLIRHDLSATWLSRARVEPIGSLAASPHLARKVVVIGASTGGTEAVREILVQMPENIAPILVVQHMPELFTAMFARRLDQTCRIAVKEAEHGEPALAGHAYVAPGNMHMEVGSRNGGYAIVLHQGGAVNRHRPSVDVLFRSAAKAACADAIGVLLTGMGTDGAMGLAALRDAGAHTIAQDAKTSVIFGMPRAAIELGAAKEIQPLHEIGKRIVVALNFRPDPTAAR